MKWILLLICTYISDTKSIKTNYIAVYKDIAIAEMHRMKIPASIKLAQAIHESQSGQSHLARNSNNHFGIKCKEYWKGYTYFHKDDDLDAKGNLIKSCFRAYGEVIESYVDHSNFLVNSTHYAVLFQLSKYDYKGWAYGLQKCGYATDPNYAEKLIKIIENEGLARYDYL